MSRPGLILKLSCHDQPGIVAKVANYVAGHRGNLVEFAQFSDKLGGKFFARLEIETMDSMSMCRISSTDLAPSVARFRPTGTSAASPTG